jgi:hypothetical protein
MRTTARSTPKLGFLAVVATLFVLGWARPAVAQQIATPTGAKSTLSIDTLSGFRVSSAGLTYAGPIGIATYRVSSGNDQTFHAVTNTTSFWLAPSADYFVIDHLSVGGLVLVQSTWSSIDASPANSHTTTTNNLPTTTNFTILPRVGYLLAIGERFGIWPRAGIGYASSSTAQDNGAKLTVNGFMLDFDVGFLYRANEVFFIKAAPELGFSLGGSSSTSAGGVTVSTDGSLLTFSLTAGLGVFIDL